MAIRNNILPDKESEQVEFKTSFNDEAIVSLVAFSNTVGGSVYIGVSDSGEVKGIQIGKETLNGWINEIKNKTMPALIPDTETLRIRNKTVAILRITEYPVKPVSLKGRYYKRTGNSNHQLSVSEVVEMHLQSINSSWDAYPDPAHTVDDLAPDKVQAAIEIMRQQQITVTETPHSFLLKYNLIRESNITNAAYLLFKKGDSVVSTIELGRFQDEITIKDTSRTKADVLTQINHVLDFVKKHINKEIIIRGDALNNTRWQYPMEAIREIVVNMIVHRDYRSASDSIIKIFDNKIEFYNPGRLPDTITVEDLMTNNYRSTPRNKLLADFFKDMGLIEKYGSGIRRVLDSFKKAQLPVPVFQNISGGFMVTVFSGSDKKVTEKVTGKVTEKVTEKVTGNQRAIMQLIRQNNYITTFDLSDKIGISQRKIKENIAKLKKEGFILRVGAAKGGHWEVVK